MIRYKKHMIEELKEMYGDNFNETFMDFLQEPEKPRGYYGDREEIKECMVIGDIVVEIIDSYTNFGNIIKNLY